MADKKQLTIILHISIGLERSSFNQGHSSMDPINFLADTSAIAAGTTAVLVTAGTAAAVSSRPISKIASRLCLSAALGTALLGLEAQLDIATSQFATANDVSISSGYKTEMSKFTTNEFPKGMRFGFC